LHSALTQDQIWACGQLLQHQFPTLGGLQPTVLSQNNGFCPVTHHESVQIHHTGHFNWVTSCSIGGEIQVYDSRFAVGPLSPSLQIQLAQIYRVSVQEEDGDTFLTVKVPAVQQQTGMVDYGIATCHCICIPCCKWRQSSRFTVPAGENAGPSSTVFQEETTHTISSHGPGQTTKARCIPLSRDRSIL